MGKGTASRSNRGRSVGCYYEACTDLGWCTCRSSVLVLPCRHPCHFPYRRPFRWEHEYREPSPMSAPGKRVVRLGRGRVHRRSPMVQPALAPSPSRLPMIQALYVHCQYSGSFSDPIDYCRLLRGEGCAGDGDAYIGWSRSRPRPSSLASFWELYSSC